MNKLAYKIERLRKPDGNVVKDINSLMPRQADKPRLLRLKDLKRVAEQDCIEMYVARAKTGKGSAVVGMASVIFYYVPTGLIAFIEEFTVNENFQGMGIGGALIRKLISRAGARKAKHISTYTNPKRLAANAVYQKLGFFRKETNFYRINLFLPPPSTKKEIADILKYGEKRFKNS